MSTRSSITWSEKLHIYYEYQEGEICIEFPIEDDEKIKLNEKYGD